MEVHGVGGNFGVCRSEDVRFWLVGEKTLRGLLEPGAFAVLYWDVQVLLIPCKETA